jgi:peptidoglycan L-alanyl-D-glutamate endopeptidase CwlK
MMIRIMNSVGKKGKNNNKDVKKIQSLLTKRGMKLGRIDGICGLRTLKAIITFQKGFMRLPDGLIEVNGKSWKKLNSSNSKNATKSQQTKSGYWSGDSSKWSQDKKLKSLNFDFRTKVKTVIKNLKNKGYEPKIFYGWRSVAVQKKLKQSGRSKVSFSFHNAQLKDGTPNSYAADIIDRRWGWSNEAQKNDFWEALGREAKAVGLVWGGDWKSLKDVAHIQGKRNGQLATIKKQSGL